MAPADMNKEEITSPERSVIAHVIKQRHVSFWSSGYDAGIHVAALIEACGV
jgi:hypothetical protein